MLADVAEAEQEEGKALLMIRALLMIPELLMIRGLLMIPALLKGCLYRWHFGVTLVCKWPLVPFLWCFDAQRGKGFAVKQTWSLVVSAEHWLRNQSTD